VENRFNLVDEPWIPVVDVGLVSLNAVFSQPEYRALGGNPVQKIALTKLLLAIAQAAATPQDDQQWQQWGIVGMNQRVLAYLEKWHDRFFLYGDRPFLQLPAIANAKIKSFGVVLPDVSTGNTTVLTQSQTEKLLSDADKAMVLVTLMGFALGGKKTDNHVILSPGYLGKTNDKGKASTGKPGPSVAYLGLLHTFCLGQVLQKTIWLNVFTVLDIQSLTQYTDLGCPPWENMPVGEVCPVAMALTTSLMGCLVPLSRFCLLAEQGLHYSEGISYGGYKEGHYDPSITANLAGKEIKVTWVNPEKRPWRELTAMLGFIDTDAKSHAECLQLRMALPKAKKNGERFAIWSGGLRVSSNAGEQFVSGSDDALESVSWIEANQVGQVWFEKFQSEMEVLDRVAKTLYGSVMGYFKELKIEGGQYAAQASHQFWQLCERESQYLIDNCEKPELRHCLRYKFTGYAAQTFNQFCPQNTARQLETWAKCRPGFAVYLQQEGV